MGDSVDQKLLPCKSPFLCLFCENAEEGLSELLIHSLSRHPVEYILLKALFRQGRRFERSELLTLPTKLEKEPRLSLSPFLKEKSSSPAIQHASSPSSSRASTSSHTRPAHRSSARDRDERRNRGAHSRSVSRELEEGELMRRRGSRSRSPHRRNGRERSPRRAPSRQNAKSSPPPRGWIKPEEPWPEGRSASWTSWIKPPVGETGPSLSPPILPGEMEACWSHLDEAEPGTLEADLKVEAAGRLAPRCRHNNTKCTRFPRCFGRLCPFRHPLCPDFGHERGCLAGNDCPFYHDEYEMTCYQCPGRLRPHLFRPLVNHCPHVKRQNCRFGPERCASSAMKCRYRHGLCPGMCEGKARVTCKYEHFAFFYFCPLCRDTFHIQ